jgi:hypothetical protein
VVTAEARDALNAVVPGVSFTWLSRTPSVATAADSGVHRALVVAQTNGATHVVATGDGISDSVTATVQQVAVTLAVSPDTVTFGRIDSVLTPVITANDARGNPILASAINWVSLNSAVATVNPATGAITSKNEPSTRVIATSGSLTDTVRVGVALVYASAQITLGGLTAPIDSALIARLNGSLQLGLVVQDVGGAVVPNPQVTWSLKTGTIASVSGTGLVSGNTNTGRDTVLVVARAVRDSVSLIVRQDLASILVTPGSPPDLNFVGETQAFVAQARDAGGSTIPGQTFTWSTNNAVLGIAASGLATAVGRTNATGVLVRVRAATGGMTDSSVTIRVKQVPSSANLNPNSFGTLTAFGRTAVAACVVLDSAADTIPNHPCTWSAVTSGVVTLSPTVGVTTTIRAVGNGSTTIKATFFQNLFAPNSITVDQVPATVTIIPANFGPTPAVQMITGQTAPFYTVVRDSANAVDTRPHTVAWSASGGATVDSTGVVTTGGTPGTASITAVVGPASGSRVVGIDSTGVPFSSVQLLFTARCANCHSGVNPPAGMSLSGNAWPNIYQVPSEEVPTLRRVRGFRPDSSYLVHKIQGTHLSVGGFGVRMPFGCPSSVACLTDATINLVRNWILQGANP